MTALPPSLGPSIWAVSDGRAGNAAQVRGIVQALSETRRWMQIAHVKGEGHRADPLTLTPGSPWTWLPADHWPAPRLALPKAQRDAIQAPWPTLWIAAGRRSAPYSAGVRQWSEGATYTVQILDPKTDPSDYDLVVVPEHDALDGPNVIRTVGSPSHFSEDAIEETGQMFADLAEERGRTAIIILGGQSKTHTFSSEAAATLERQLTALSGLGWRLRITASRRTPIEIVARMRQLADEIGALFWAGAEDGPNPYLGWLLFSDAAIVTEDSANMLSDAAWHGLPIHMARLEGQSPKFDRLHDSLITRGCAKWFEGSLSTWTYDPLREAGRVADRIISDLLTRYPQPAMPAAPKGGQVAPPDWL
ncbi:MAG: mitochondrial fission ELM1 family protein [Pseudomonadota bacterium]